MVKAVKAKKGIRIINNTTMELHVIQKMKHVGAIKHHWRQRDIALYESDVDGHLYMIGKTFDGSTIIITTSASG